MQSDPPPSPLDRHDPSPRQHETAKEQKKWFWPILAVGGLLLKFKSIILPALKFIPAILKTGGTMLLSVWLYAQIYGVPFAVGFVVMILIHEFGHLVAARAMGLKVGAPVFIPFMGAAIALKEAPKNAWIEAVVGIGGPVFGAAASFAAYGLFLQTGDPLYAALCYTGCFLNLFNLAPVGFLDGGRIATALSPWLWIAGAAVIGYLFYQHPNFILALILILSIPRLISLFRKRSEEEQRFFEVTPARRWLMGFAYFGLAAVLAVGMQIAHHDPRGY